MLDDFIKDKDLNWSKCLRVCTNDAGVLCGWNSSFIISEVREVNSSGALASKTLPDKLKNALHITVKIVNHIQSTPLQCRLLEVLSEDMGTIHKFLLLNTETIAVLLDKGIYAELLRDGRFVLKLTYLADRFSKLNQLNLHLQGIEESDISVAEDKIRDFKRKTD
ncbi:Zinc finger BED domain-containing protein 5 [Trichinella pseudospiralis]|uniref:Zinc finger BED domain-containing protein 5 n=1 Tax=Trichinella pseudospiralis TaxID=6337 RepID=A0A0V1E7H1_TRIPS|nr:Zinc finger BED domain-containing protein 5 [Trichinella pseudospiralis]KRZ27242.1 Zinc finger BED domain-containing protein 5 [Trichinella pseudospiralis]KRZ31014.1 Zinc finger BED domain-containing protein 5 [Trichinella pseudospiralis]